MKVDCYPLPRIEDIFAFLLGGQSFSKLDFAHAYQQSLLDEELKAYVTVNTHKGLFQYNRLPFGVASISAIFQTTMDSMLQGIPGTCAYLNNILVTEKSEEENLRILDAVLERLENTGLHLKHKKCAFMLSQIEYSGHLVTTEGLKLTTEKIGVIQDVLTPENMQQLRSFLEMLNYFGKSLPNLATHLAPLYELL